MENVLDGSGDSAKKATEPISESKIEQKGAGLREVLNGIAAGSSGRRRPE